MNIGMIRKNLLLLMLKFVVRVMIYAYISYKGALLIINCKKTVNNDYYIENILKPTIFLENFL